MSNKISDDPSPHGLGTEKEDTKDDEQAETFEKREETARGVFDFDEDATVSGMQNRFSQSIPFPNAFEFL